VLNVKARALILRVNTPFIKPDYTVFANTVLVQWRQTRILCAHENLPEQSAPRVHGGPYAVRMRWQRTGRYQACNR
jgi:hypothetical protein